MKKYDCIFLDRDGTINPDPGYIKSLNEFKFYDYTIPALKKISSQGYKFCIVTNQSGVSRGLIEKENLDQINAYIKSEFKKNMIPLLGIYMCLDHPNSATIMRKPGPGMFLKAKKDNGIDLVNSLIIGDSYVDMQAGDLLGMDRMLVLSGVGKETLSSLPKDKMPNYIVNNLYEGVNKLCQ